MLSKLQLNAVLVKYTRKHQLGSKGKLLQFALRGASLVAKEIGPPEIKPEEMERFFKKNESVIKRLRKDNLRLKSEK